LGDWFGGEGLGEGSSDLMIATEGESSKTTKDGAKEYDIQGLLKNLNLHKAELKDVALGKEKVRSWPEVKWLAAARVLTEKGFSMESLKNIIYSTWTQVRDVFMT
jgi:hypothetical protein